MHCPYCAEQIKEGCQKCPLCEEPLGEGNAKPVPPPLPEIPTPVPDEEVEKRVEELENFTRKAGINLTEEMYKYRAGSIEEDDDQEIVDLADANSKATWALVFGFLSFPGLLCCVVSFIFGGLGIYGGLSSNEIFRRYNQPPNDKATAGIFLGTIAIILTIGLKLLNIFW